MSMQRRNTIFYIILLLFIIMLLLSIISTLFLILAIPLSLFLVGPDYKLVIPFYFILILILGLRIDYYFIGTFLTVFIVLFIFIRESIKKSSF